MRRLTTAASRTAVASWARQRMSSAGSAAAAGLLPGAGATGLEPATSGVTGRRSNRLSYAPVRGTVWHPSGERAGRRRQDCLRTHSGSCTDMYIGIGTLLIIIILLIILL